MKDQLAFFIDVDGTIFMPEQVRTPDEILEAVAKLRGAGHLCFLATGRPYSQIEPRLRNLPFDGMLLARGAHTILNGEAFTQRPLPYEDAKEYVGILKENGIQYALFDDRFSYVPKEYGQVFEFYAPRDVDESLYVSDFNEDEVLRRLLKIEVMVESEEKRKVIYDNTVGKLAIAGSPRGLRLDVYQIGVTKGDEVERVIDYLGLPRGATVGIGDSPNDLEMLEAVGHPVAMGNALPEVKDKAEVVIGDVLQNGVASFIDDVLAGEVLLD